MHIKVLAGSLRIKDDMSHDVIKHFLPVVLTDATTMMYTTKLKSEPLPLDVLISNYGNVYVLYCFNLKIS